MKVKYLDLQAQYQTIKKEIDEAIKDVIDSSAFILGKAVDDFENQFASYCQTDHAIGVNNGTNAVMLALKALGIGPGDEIITAANTFVATLAAIVHAGARPVLVDVDPETANMDPQLLKLAISTRTRAIVPVHLYGRLCDMAAISQIASKNNVSIIEDAAQAHGATIDGRRAGSFGMAAAFSFYPGKNLGAFGEAGAIVTSDERINRMTRTLRDHGSSDKNVHKYVGYNARMEGLQGAVLGIKLKHLDRWITARRKIAARYNSLLKEVPVKTPSMTEESSHVFHCYVIECEQRDELREFLAKREIPTLIHYPIPVHLQKAYTFLDYRQGDFPVAEKMAQEIISLPIYPELCREEVEYVAGVIAEFFKHR